MRLRNITATPHPSGNKIVLKWENPDPGQYPGVCVRRREGTHPTAPDDGALVWAGEGQEQVDDEGLKGETVYYYTLFPYKGDPPEYEFHRHNRIAAMATAPHNMAGQIYELLPGIYHRYDGTLSDHAAEEDKEKGQLRRFLDLPGGQLDLIYSFARAMLDLYNIGEVDGRLLPLLGQWIGWPTDHRLETDSQRNEIRNAPYIYRTIGIIPTVEATVKRLTDWESRTKEFIHNIFVTNRPERLNLWARCRTTSGEWSKPEEPLSLDFAYEGRPTAVRDKDTGVVWLFYHTDRNGYWDIWYKVLSTFSLSLELRSDLDSKVVSANLRQAFEEKGYLLSESATIGKRHVIYVISDPDNMETYTVMAEADQLDVYLWSPSQPITNRTGLHDRHPAAVVWGGNLWLFWDCYDSMDDVWRIDYCIQSGGERSSINTFGSLEAERRMPAVVVDQSHGLWLFWLERQDTTAPWQVRYKRYETANEGLNPADSFVLDNGIYSGSERDLFVFLQPAGSVERLWVFWSHRVYVDLTQPSEGSNDAGNLYQTRWEIAYRFKEEPDPGGAGWTEVRLLPKTTPDYNDRDPAVVLDADERIELFWSSDQDGSWSLWRSALLDVEANDWEPAEQITGNPYSQRHPLPVPMNTGTWLVYRSNESLLYTSEVYAATETLDTRYAGCTTIDTRNLAKIALHRRFGDFLTYSYGTGQKGKRTDQDWYARDTVGMYLTPDTDDQKAIVRNRQIIESVLRQFLPIQVRTVFVIPIVSEELVYQPPERITDESYDSMTTITTETYTGLSDSYEDTIPEWVWMHSWSEVHTDYMTVDFRTEPIDTRFRTWQVGLRVGG